MKILSHFYILGDTRVIYNTWTHAKMYLDPCQFKIVQLSLWGFIYPSLAKEMPILQKELKANEVPEIKKKILKLVLL